MPVPTTLDVTITVAEFDAMIDAAKLINNTIKAKIDFNLSNDERQSLSKVGPEREFYVGKSVNDYGVAYPHLNGLSVPHALAVKDADVNSQMNELLTWLKQATERVEELEMLSGHFAFTFMSEQYANAKAYKDKNVEGAQVVYDGLKGCFEGQGPQGGNQEP